MNSNRETVTPRTEAMRFPRIGLPVLPATLKALFFKRIKHPMLEDGSLATNSEELDQNIWRRRNATECRTLSKVLAARLSSMYEKKNPRLQTIFVPRVFPVRRLDELPLSDMVIDTLKRTGFSDTEQLQHMSIADLMGFPTMGARRVFELIAVLDDISSPSTETVRTTIVTHGSPEDIRCIENIIALLRDKDLDSRDIRFGHYILQLRTHKPTLKAALAALKSGASTLSEFDPWPELRVQLQALHDRLAQVHSYSLPQDLMDILATIATPRKAYLIARRLGWHDGVERTLQEVGDEVGVTRERIRQLEARAQQKLVGHTVYAPALLAALSRARCMAPCNGSELSKSLMTEQITDVPWTAGLLVRAAGYLGIPHALSLHSWEGAEYLAVEPFTPQVFARVRRLSWEAARAEGAAHLPRIAFALSEELERRVSLAEVRSLVKTLPEIKWVDESGGWYWLGDDGNTAIFNTVRKILSVSRRLPIDDLYEGLLKSYRMDDSIVAPKPIVLKMLAQVPWIRIRQISHVEAEPPIAPQDVLGNTELVMVQVLQEAGGALDHYDFRRRCQEKGVAAATFGVYEGNSGLFVRISRGVWGLRGVDMDAEKLALIQRKMKDRQLRFALEASERALAHIPAQAFSRSNGYIRMYKVTASTFRHHVMTLARVTGVAPGTKFSVTLDATCCGEVRITEDRRLRGLLPLLRNAGIQVGQTFIAQFDLKERTLRLERVSRDEITSPNET